jgi:hypothetical protein
MFRLTNPVAMIEMQQALVRAYLDAIVAGQACCWARRVGRPRTPAPSRHDA